jgi:hypothetical protein
MKTHYLAIAAASLATVLTGSAMASEFDDAAIVVSDGWCAPYNDGNCYKCNSGHLITNATCTGSYCDNMRYQCAAPPSVSGQTTSLSGYPFTINEFDSTQGYGWTSDEQGANSTRAVCPVGYAMVGMTSSNSNSDNLRTICQQIDRNGGWGGVTVTRNRAGSSISEEAPHTFFAAPGTWLMGASCTGSFCDNMYYWYVSIS